MIEEFIPKGYKNRVSRGYLHEILHISDRDIRKQIEEAADRGILIASYDGGYFQYGGRRDDEYFADYFRREEHRTRTLSRNVRKKKKRFMAITGKDPKQIPGQMSFFKG